MQLWPATNRPQGPSHVAMQPRGDGSIAQPAWVGESFLSPFIGDMCQVLAESKQMDSIVKGCHVEGPGARAQRTGYGYAHATLQRRKLGCQQMKPLPQATPASPWSCAGAPERRIEAGAGPGVVLAAAKTATNSLTPVSGPGRPAALGHGTEGRSE